MRLSDRLKKYIPFFGAYLPDKGTIFSAYITSGPKGSLYCVRHSKNQTEAILHVITKINILPYVLLYDKVKNNKPISITKSIQCIDIGIQPIHGEEEADILFLYDWQSRFTLEMIVEELLVNGNDYFETETSDHKNDSLLLQIKGLDDNKFFKITEFPCVIGRSQTSDIQIFNNFVSRRHILIDKLSDSIYTVKDLDSSNKTLLNQFELIPHKIYPIKKGDIISISDYSIILL